MAQDGTTPSSDGRAAAAPPLARVRGPLRLTRLGLWAERITKAFWPVWSVLFLAVAIWSSGLVPPLWEGSLLIALAALALMLAVVGLRGFRRPTEAEAQARLDATLPGRPIETLSDAQAIGAADPASAAVWRAHRARLATRLDGARAVAPNLRVARRDPYALRYVALLLAAVGLTFGTVLRAPALPDLAVGDGTAVAAGPTWEGWLEPPRHTGRPTLYLNEIEPGAVEVPQGTRVVLRLYGEVGAQAVSETVSGRSETVPIAPIQEFEVTRSGTLTIDGPGDDPTWTLTAAVDAVPEIALDGTPDFELPDAAVLPWLARDDHGVVAAQVTFGLDLPAVDRDHGLAVAPEPRDPVTLDIPLPVAGDRTRIADVFRFDLSKHPFAGLPVVAALSATDAADQTGTRDEPMVLPARPFYDAAAAALVEQRRDLLWSRENRARVAQVLRTITWKADDVFHSPAAFLITRSAIRRLESVDALSPELRDEIAEMLWEAAVRLEGNSLDSALQRLRQAQDRLSEAIRNGASPEEIARLTEEMRRAMDDYTRQLAQQQGQQGQQGQQQAQGDMQQVTPDMLDQLMQRIEELMAQGRVAEAQELLRQLEEMMQNLQVTQGQGGGQGQPGEGQQAMDELRDTIREQQGLSDDAFRELQEQFNPNAQAGQSQQNQGRSGSQGQGTQHSQGQGQGQPGAQQGQGADGAPQQGEGRRPGAGEQDQAEGGEGREGGEEGGSEGDGGTSAAELARRQAELRRELETLRNALPGAGSEAGDDAREALDRAGRAMEDAERDLEVGNLGGALDDQSQAIDALREGLQELGRALAGDRDQMQPGEGEGDRRGRANARDGDGRDRDPLGRNSGEGARFGTDDQFLDGLGAARRSRELQDEIRRRLGEQDRPEVERDYLKRLLERF